MLLTRAASLAPALMAAVLLVGLSPARTAAQILHDPRLAHEVLYTGSGMVSLAFAPDGRLYVCEKRGRVLTFAPDGKGGFAPPTVFLGLTREVTFEIESGLLGIALDPAFATTRHVFLYYTRKDGPRLVRVTATAGLEAAEPGSAQVLLANLPNTATHHKAGQIAFRPSEPNAIYLGMGDDAHPEHAQDVDRYEGKILRLNKDDGRGLRDNPFCTGGDLDSVRCRVWARGLRNPFRFLFLPGSPPNGPLYLSENGDLIDRLSRVSAGSNGAWSKQGDRGGFLSPPDPGHRVLSTQTGSRTAIAFTDHGGFAAAPGKPTLLSANGVAGSIQRYALEGEALDRVTPLDHGLAFLSDLPFAGAVDMAFGPDGALYYVHSGVDASDTGRFLLARVRALDGAFAPRPEPASNDAAQAAAPSGDKRCDDLSAIAPWGEVAYDNHVQPLWATQCEGCHGGPTGGAAGLDLRFGSAARLISAASKTAPGRVLVKPGSPEQSYLFEKINCGHPTHGARMRPGVAMGLEKQALIRDWIVQLANPPRQPPRIRVRHIAAAMLAAAAAGLWVWRRRRARA
jgi:hypothetical protein